MSATPALSALQAKQLVRARLGRDPQDMLEAAVVLEAWGGAQAAQALDSGRALVRAAPLDRLASVSRAHEEAPRTGFAWEAIAFVVAIMAIAWWAAPLAETLGNSTVARAILFALPSTLALQWALSSRYLSQEEGLAQLARHRRSLVVIAVAMVLGAWLAAGPSGRLAGLLVITWTGGVVLIRRGWAPAYALIVIVATGAMAFDVHAVSVMVGASTATAIAVLAALSGLAPSGRRPPARWGRTLACMAVGACLGAMLVSDPSLRWADGPTAAIALLPSALAGLWSGYHLWQFQRVLVDSLRGEPVTAAGGDRLASAPLRILGGAVVRLSAACGVLSAALVAVVWWIDDRVLNIPGLVGFGLIGLATLLLSFLASVHRSGWALAAAAAGLAAALATRLPGLDLGVAAAALIAGGVVASAIALPAAIAAMRRPEATLATTLWIP